MGIWQLGWCKKHTICNIYNALLENTHAAKTKGKTLDMVSINKLVCLYFEFLHSPACRLRCVCVDSGWCTWCLSDAALGLVSITVATLLDIRSWENEEAEAEECFLLPDLLYRSLWSAEVISYIPPLQSSKSLEEIQHSPSLSVNAFIQVWQIPHFSCLCKPYSSLSLFILFYPHRLVKMASHLNDYDGRVDLKSNSSLMTVTSHPLSLSFSHPLSRSLYLVFSDTGWEPW